MSKVKKKLLTIEDLVHFCKEQNFSNFSAKDSGYQLSVQLPTTFEVESEYKDNTLLFCNVKLFHVGANRNNSSVTEEAAQKALPTIAYKPLLANFCEIDGVKDFTSHDMFIDDDGNMQYIEHQIGCFTADDPVIKYDEETEKKFVYAKVAIPREYTDACEIIERKDGTKISVELLINEMQYSVKDNILELTDVIVQGATCLGKNPETGENVEEGMKGARLDIESFSNQNNSVVVDVDAKFSDKLVEMLERIENAVDALSRFNDKTDSVKEGGNEMNKFDELLELYGLVADDIDFEVENLSDEDLEAAFVEKFGTAEEYKASKETPVVEDEKFELVYALSHDDVRTGLYGLLNSTIGTDSYAWICEVFDDHFIYNKETYNDSGYECKYFKQSYSVDGEEVSFGAEPVEVFTEFITAEEKIALEALRLEYADLKKFKEEYDAAIVQAEKDEVFADEKYSVLEGNENFEQLKKDAANFSVNEIKDKCKIIFAEHVMETGEYSASCESTEKKTRKIGFNFEDKPVKTEAYGGLFK